MFGCNQLIAAHTASEAHEIELRALRTRASELWEELKKEKIETARLRSVIARHIKALSNETDSSQVSTSGSGGSGGSGGAASATQSLSAKLESETRRADKAIAEAAMYKKKIDELEKQIALTKLNQKSASKK